MKEISYMFFFFKYQSSLTTFVFVFYGAFLNFTLEYLIIINSLIFFEFAYLKYEFATK